MNNEILIQRLVDGDLSSQERQQALRRFQESDQWQDLALAFVEKQILDETIGGIARETSPRQAEDVATPRQPAASIERTARPNRSWWKGMARLAAGVLLLVSGYLLGAGQPDARLTSSAQLESGQANVNPGATPKEAMAIQLDLSEALARSATPIPSRFRLDLLQAGYVLCEDEQLTKVSLPFGGTMQMPIRKVDVRYLGASAFQ